MSSLQTLPKAELHAHLEGSVDRDCLNLLAARNGIALDAPTLIPGIPPIPAPRPELLQGPFCGTFFDFISLYVKISSAIKNAEDIVLVASRYAETAATENIVSAELYVTPTTLKYLGCPVEELALGLAEAERVCRENHKITVGWIFDIVRNSPIPAEETLLMAEECRKRGVRVVALGVAGLERGYSAKPFRPVLEKARAAGYAVLIHAGETAGPESIWEAIDVLGADRIGHGIASVQDARLLSLLAERKITVEVSPWSNILLGNSTKENHPLRQMIEGGVQVVIAADDPGIFGKSLSDNYHFAAQQGVSLAVLREIAERGLKESLVA